MVSVTVLGLWLVGSCSYKAGISHFPFSQISLYISNSNTLAGGSYLDDKERRLEEGNFLDYLDPKN